MSKVSYLSDERWKNLDVSHARDMIRLVNNYTERNCYYNKNNEIEIPDLPSHISVHALKSRIIHLLDELS